MSNPQQIYFQVPLCEPTTPEIQALAACQYVLDRMIDFGPNTFERKRMIVAWLAEAYSDKGEVR
jgi:hypothetical protein